MWGRFAGSLSRTLRWSMLCHISVTMSTTFCLVNEASFSGHAWRCLCIILVSNCSMSRCTSAWRCVSFTCSKPVTLPPWCKTTWSMSRRACKSSGVRWSANQSSSTTTDSEECAAGGMPQTTPPPCPALGSSPSPGTGMLSNLGAPSPAQTLHRCLP